MNKKRPRQFIVLDVVEKVSVADTLLTESSSGLVLELQRDDSLSPYTVLPLGKAKHSEMFTQSKIVKSIPLSVKLPIKL